jgi:hypothetical protein
MQVQLFAAENAAKRMFKTAQWTER